MQQNYVFEISTSPETKLWLAVVQRAVLDFDSWLTGWKLLNAKERVNGMQNRLHKQAKQSMEYNLNHLICNMRTAHFAAICDSVGFNSDKIINFCLREMDNAKFRGETK